MRLSSFSGTQEPVNTTGYVSCESISSVTPCNSLALSPSNAMVGLSVLGFAVVTLSRHLLKTYDVPSIVPVNKDGKDTLLKPFEGATV